MKTMIRTLLKKKKLLLWGTVTLITVALFLGGNLISLMHNKIELHRLRRQNVQLDQEYDSFLQTKQRLEQEDPVLLEQLARTQYNLAKPNEVEFRFHSK